MDLRPVVVLWGPTEEKDAIAFINRQWLGQFHAQAPGRWMGVDPKKKIPASARVVIHHEYGRNFKTVAPPRGKKSVAVRTWDFGPFPSAWAKKIRNDFDQLWVYSRWTKQMAIEGGVPPEMIRVVALGVDDKVFGPEGPKFPLSTDKSFRFLFLGPAILRKGVDILLKAYRAAFTAQDDVCLVVKDFSRHPIYRSVNSRNLVRQMKKDPRAPEVIYLDSYLTESDLAALYRSGTFAVFPYRAEGFSIPILEAMASGTIPIVPDFGACLDFCRPENARLVPAIRIQCPVHRDFRINGHGIEESIEAVDFCETKVDALAEQMLAARALSGKRIAEMRRAGISTVKEKYTWAQSARAMNRHVKELLT